MQTSDTLAYLISQGFSPTIITRFWKYVRKTEGCWLWTAGTHAGYGSIPKGLDPNRKDKTQKTRWVQAVASRVSWMIHYGPIPDGMHVCHHCDNPPCTRPDHLFLGTDKDNSDDKMEKGRHRSYRILDEERVREIWNFFGVMTQCDIAKKYGVHQSTISDIWRGKHWSHVIPCTFSSDRHRRPHKSPA